MAKYPKRGGSCEYTWDCMWGADGQCDRPPRWMCEIKKMEIAKKKEDAEKGKDAKKG